MTIAAMTRPARFMLALLAMLPAAASAQTLEGRRLCECYVTDLSDDGRAATGQLAGSNQTFRWTEEGGVQPLGRGTFRKLRRGSGTPAISGDGQTIASTIIDDTQSLGTQGLWTAATGWRQLMPPRPADGAVVDAEDGSVFGMSRDGRVVTGLYWRNTAEGGLAHASRWLEAGVVEDMGSSGGSSRIDDANADGRVLVGWDEHPQFGNRRAAVWVDGVKTVLDESDWPSEAAAVNARGNIIVGQAVDPKRGIESAVMWTWNGRKWAKKVLGVLEGTKLGGSAYASGLSDDGQTVVGTANRFFSPASKGFVWTAATGMVEAEKYFADRGYDPGGKLSVESVNAISGDGQVMGVVGTDLDSGKVHSVAVRTLTAAH